MNSTPFGNGPHRPKWLQMGCKKAGERSVVKRGFSGTSFLIVHTDVALCVPHLSFASRRLWCSPKKGHVAVSWNSIPVFPSSLPATLVRICNLSSIAQKCRLIKQVVCGESGGLSCLLDCFIHRCFTSACSAFFTHVVLDFDTLFWGWQGNCLKDSKNWTIDTKPFLTFKNSVFPKSGRKERSGTL